MDDHNQRPNQCRWLSQDLSALIRQQSAKQEMYDLVIVGSGYGGAMAAAELAELAGLTDKQGKPFKICLLERGKEYLPGSFPSQMGEVPGHVRVVTPNAKKPQGFGDGLFDIRIGPDVCALVANGLGGGSLINAGVMEIPKWGSFADKLPPDVLSDLAAANYDEIKQKLGSVANAIEQHPNVSSKQPLDRTRALQALDPGNFPLQDERGRELAVAHKFRQAALTIKMSEAPEANLNTCTLCGDCMTGCNIGAKKSLDTNLLAQAAEHKVEIYTGACVLNLERTKPPTALGQDKFCWQLNIAYSDEDTRKHQGDPLKLLARKVILAAGTLGSPEILLHSRSDELQFSSRLGQQFSCNGDNIATFYKLATPVNAVADENTPITMGSRRIGPTITGMLDIPVTAATQGFLLQEFAIPGPMARLFAEAVTTANTLYELPEADCSMHKPANRDSNDLDPCAVNPQAINHSQLIGVIGHDSSNGVLRLEHENNRNSDQIHSGMIQIAWPDARHGQTMSDAMNYLQTLGQQSKTLLQTDGRLIPNPMWQVGPEALAELIDQPRGPVLTVHPLGGCPMGSSVENGVVDDCGMVFDAACPKSDTGESALDHWQGSLFVLDGSIIPASLGANPALTIATLAFRACGKLRPKWTAEMQLQPGTHENHRALVPRPIFRAAADCTSAAQPTRLKMAERLVGNMLIYRDDGVMDDFWVELTLRYQAIEIQQLMSTLDRRVILEPTSTPSASSPGTGSRIRIFSKHEWPRLEFASERERERCALFKADLEGELEIFNREASNSFTRLWRGLSAWLPNRGLRDMTQLVLDQLAQPGDISKNLSILFNRAVKMGGNIKNIASHAGEVRRLDYKLKIGFGETRCDSPIFQRRPYKGLEIIGEKRLTYNRRANPLRQLKDLQITEFPAMPGGVHSQLALDLSFVALQEIPLAQIVGQKNQINALSDITSFGLYLLRLMLITHMWTFRKPDASPTREAERLPQALPDLPEPEITEIDLRPPRSGIPVRVRLTRYRKTDICQPCQSCQPDLRPLVMIHGYSASGTTFAHPAIATSMAQYFAERGRDIWILDLRTSAGMPSAKLPWHFEDAALEDIPVAIAHILRVTGQPQVDIFAHCIGATMLSMAILTDPEQMEQVFPRELVDWQDPPSRYYRAELALMQKSIRRIILSQKGPALVYTADNMLRAWLMRSLRKLVLPDNFQFSLPQHPSLRDQLLDRWLNVLSYHEEEFDAENPFIWYNPLQWGKRTPWVGFRHRMDALYARDFSVNNIPETTRAAITDLFGPLNLETVSQAIHFVRYNKITDAYGRNIFVSRANLAKYWSAVEYTMSIHGAENGLVHPETLNSMSALMKDANIPFKAHPAFEGMGHQDMLIGKDNTQVFAEIEAFLQANAPLLPPNATENIVCGLPWVGPRLEARPTGLNAIAVMPDPRLGNGLVLAIPVLHPEGGDFTLAAGFPGEITPSPAPAEHWTVLEPDPALLELPQANGLLVVMLYEEVGSPSEGIPSPAATIVSADTAKLTMILKKIADLYEPGAIEPHFITKDALQKPIGIGTEDTSSLCFAFGSCQYQVGLMDRPVAQASIERLARRLDNKPHQSALQPELLLLLGDQIYSDATAGLLDPSRADARYLHPHEDWLRMPPLREVMRKIPVYCMLDDHEIIDNWSPHADKKTPPKPDWHLTQGRKYYRQFQPRAANQKPLGQTELELWYAFEHQGLPFFMADSRTERQERNAANASGQTILGDRQMFELKGWLAGCDSNKPKIISTASMLLPRHVADDSDLLSLDGWDGFPASLHELLSFIVDNQIQKVIFLSGDEHVSSVTQITLKNTTQNKEVAILSLHSSGFYAPFPFSNALPASIPEEDAFSFPQSGRNYHCHTQTTIINQGDGYMLAKLSQDHANQWLLDLEFDGRNGTWHWPQAPWKL